MRGLILKTGTRQLIDWADREGEVDNKEGEGMSKHCVLCDHNKHIMFINFRHSRTGDTLTPYHIRHTHKEHNTELVVKLNRLQ